MTEQCAWCGGQAKAECKNIKSCHKDKPGQRWGCMDDIDLLTTCGIFDTNDCISHEDMRHLFKVKEKQIDN
jgi:hypothetical protein